jgi:hypothetical protein
MEEKRFTNPCRYDKAPFGQTVEVADDQTSTIWIQLSKDEDKPDWHTMAHLLALVYRDKLNDKDFIQDLLAQLHC